MKDAYYDPKHLKQFADIGKTAPSMARGFFSWYAEVFADSALSRREKCLAALAVAYAVQCPYCIEAYTKNCLEEGSSIEEMTEIAHVAAVIKGGAALIHGMQMRDQAEKISL